MDESWMKCWQGSDSKRKVMSRGRQAIGSAALTGPAP
jgi:hypothetical protein